MNKRFVQALACVYAANPYAFLEDMKKKAYEEMNTREQIAFLKKHAKTVKKRADRDEVKRTISELENKLTEEGRRSLEAYLSIFKE